MAEVGKRPQKWRVEACPTCGHARDVLNGQWLRYMRLAKGLSQREAGRQLGISSPYLSDLENNRRECPPSIWAGYANLKAPVRS